MSLPNHSLIARLLPLTFVLALAGTSLLGCGKEAPTATASPEQETALEHARKHLDTTYVCPMHPQVVSSEPGECPICGMDLVPREVDAEVEGPAAGGTAEAPAITVSDAVVNQLGVRTAEVRRGTLVRSIETFGVFVRSTVASAHLVVAQVFERDAPLVKQGQTARVRFPSLGSREWQGTISSLESQVNPTTHTLQVRVSFDSEGAAVPGGMTALVTLEVDPATDVLLVPREAVIVTGRGARVMVAQGAGRFEQRAVEGEDLGEEEIVIRSGLAEGEQVVVSAQFLLDSEANLQAGLKRLAGTQPADPTEHPAEATLQDPAHEGHMHQDDMREAHREQGQAHEGHAHAGAMPEDAAQPQAPDEAAPHDGGADLGAMDQGPAAGTAQ
jgi:hypothetical protein